MIGAVTSAGGSAAIVADNASTNVDVSTGDAEASNDLAAFVGQADGSVLALTADIINLPACDGCDNVQEGSNRLTSSQVADASSGDGAAGQVLGVVSAGRTSVDARNRSSNVDAGTGDASTTNAASALVGQNVGRIRATLADLINVHPRDNAQEGDNTGRVGQSASASSGDAVLGQVTGVVTSAGGSATVVVDNLSDNTEATSGDSTFANDLGLFVGLNTSGVLTVG